MALATSGRLARGEVQSSGASARVAEAPWRTWVPAVALARDAVAPVLIAVAPAFAGASEMSGWRSPAGRLRSQAGRSRALKRNDPRPELQSPFRRSTSDGACRVLSTLAPKLAVPLSFHLNPCLPLTAVDRSASSHDMRSRPVHRRTISRQFRRPRFPACAVRETPLRGSRLASADAMAQLPARSASEAISYNAASTTRAACPQTPGDRR